MVSVSKLMAARGFRIVVAAVLTLVLFHFVYVQNSLNWRSSKTSTTRPSHSGPVQIIADDAVATSPIPPTSTEAAEPTSQPHPSHLPELPPLPHNVKTAIAQIPDKVWHSAKTHHVSENQLAWINSWTDVNPAHREELLTDASGEAFVEAHYQHTRPDIVEVYKELRIPILKADLLRYLAVLAEGGIWSDLDVSCDKAVADWVPPEYQDQKIDMIVGLEFDLDWRGPGTEVASQFCNWAFAARPSSRNLQVVVDTVIRVLKDIAHTNHVGISGIILEMLSDVVNVTGPKIMTVALMDSLTQLLGREVDDRDFAHIKHPKLVGDLLIMPGVSFAALQNGNPKDQGDALVSHHYEGSWKQADAEAKERKKEKNPPTVTTRNSEYVQK
ncbi:Alpha-1,6-mannosyltransferase [Penicillium ucsense]|uniref:Alpha-1,6-mannosyltransferase n=1 Tax=Penicillium ucsense TaxID=2839758 RepID=A0A8J8W5E5_9EURO|nr:Alpha-1,6-mannosyltransferase [Penicillium ucsense]KAF7737505.1 Alpha-1,6-mannosyltransferase [Penicillium ucsense]